MYAMGENTKNPMYFVNLYDYTRQLANAIGNEEVFNKEYSIKGRRE